MAERLHDRRTPLHRLLIAWLVTAGLSLNALAVAPAVAVDVACAPAMSHCAADDPAGCAGQHGSAASCLSACVAGSPALTATPVSFDEVAIPPALPALSVSQRVPFHFAPPLRPPISR